MSCAAAVATLDVLDQEQVLSNVKARGTQLMHGLLKIQKEALPGLVIDVRGKGLMIGVEFGKPSSHGSSLKPDTKHQRVLGPASKGFASAVTQACSRRDMLLLSAGARETVRFLPPLTVTQQEVDLALGIFKEAIDETASLLKV